MNTRITEIRKSYNMTQERFAEEMGISKNYVNLIENGKKNPGDRLISDICRRFNVNETWLRTGQGNPSKEEDIDFGKICADIGVNDPIAREAIEKYYELSPEDKELWWKFMEKFILN